MTDYEELAAKLEDVAPMYGDFSRDLLRSAAAMLRARGEEVRVLREKQEAVKANLIEMRRYVLHHGVLLGECVAWNKLKEMFGVGME